MALKKAFGHLIVAGTVLVPLCQAAPVAADSAGDLLARVAALNKAELKGEQGFLFKGLFQMDPENPNYVVYIADRKYTVVLDDGRGTSERAKQCKEENFFDENPRTGCEISFDGEYLVDDQSTGSIEVTLKIWNVVFQ
jgi:hypothetical protein